MENRSETDRVMMNLLFCLVRDFRTSQGAEYGTKLLESIEKFGIKGYRDFKWPSRCTAPPCLFKQEAQLQNLFKRYRFKDDMYTTDQLIAITRKKFEDTQKRISSPLSITPTVLRVLERSADIIRDILGQYDPTEHADLCRFGKRACANVPYSKSYLDFKLGMPVTGSQDHIQWFKQYVAEDRLLSSVICEGQGNPDIAYEVCDTLTLSFVPKSFKSLRIVKPPTLIGSFYTYGLGRVIQDRLLKEGLDIRRLQEKHRRLVQVNSRTRRLVTADLSAASDSISRELLEWLLPHDWYQACMFGVVPFICFKGDKVAQELNSVATMGDGHTFPLQTLIFYGLIKAIAELSGNLDTFVSVYGDDLIYPRGIHRYVKAIFPKLHLLLNGDKTYVQDYFRESCGSDYYHGVDVRPFQPEGEYRLLGRQPYAVFLYKLINGLSLRWAAEEIPQSLEYLLCELRLSQRVVFQVPPSFPDGSGVKTRDIVRTSLYAPVVYDQLSQTWKFKYLHVCADFRVVENQSPYYWEWLRASNNAESVENPWEIGDEPVLRWRKLNPPRFVYSKLHGKRLRRLQCGVSSKTANRVLGQTGSTSCWI